MCCLLCDDCFDLFVCEVVVLYYVCDLCFDWIVDDQYVIVVCFLCV